MFFQVIYKPFSVHFQVDQSALGLSREYLIKGLDDKIVKAYYNYMVDIAVIYGAERERAESELMESLEFEMALANVSAQHRVISQMTDRLIPLLLTLVSDLLAK